MVPLVILVLVVLLVAYTGVRLLRRANSLRAHLQQLEALSQAAPAGLALEDLERAGSHLSAMRHDLQVIQTLVGPLLPVIERLHWLPRYGDDLAAAPELLRMASGVTAAGDGAFQALAPALEGFAASPAGTGSAATGLEQIVPVLQAAQPELLAAQQELVAVQQARAQIDAQRLSPQVAGLVARLDRYLPWFQTAVDGALLAPTLLGADGPRTYLILAQNNHELRPTGGFISGVGELHVDGGRLKSLSFTDSYAVDNLEVPHDLTPLDLQQTLAAQLWLLRDANWDADFPTSARRVLDIYQRDRGVQADGVIALDLTALEWLVDALGPIPLPDGDQSLTGDNLVRLLQAQWENPEGGPALEGRWDAEWWQHRKDFMGEIAGAALDKLLAAPSGAGQVASGLDLVALARTLSRSLDEKHLLLYFTDPQAGTLLRARNWDGALSVPPLPMDALLVVDTNVGFNKVDPNVARTMHYALDLGAADGPEARLTVTYQNHSTRAVDGCVQEAWYGDSYTDMMDRCYWNYMRVYVPAGSQLLEGPDLALPPGSLLAQSSDLALPATISPTLAGSNWTVWAAFFDVAPGADRSLAYHYRLPSSVLEPTPEGLVQYRLRVQKQPGTRAVPLQLEVRLPPGAELVTASPAGALSMDGGVLSASMDLRRDRYVEIVFRDGR
jgi:hypothetical protein